MWNNYVKTAEPMEEVIERLHETSCSCVIRKGDDWRTFYRRGVIDLFELYRTDPAFMKGASVADKVIGKGAAALMALGGISEVYADVISTPALELLQDYGICVTCQKEVPYIENRDKTGHCPLETACLPCKNADEIYPVICDFISKISLYLQNTGGTAGEVTPVK